MFRRFVPLGLSEGVPDHSTLWRFRNRLEKTGLYERLRDVINPQLSGRGRLIRSGEVSIIDASVIEAKQNRPGITLVDGKKLFMGSSGTGALVDGADPTGR